MKELRPGIVGTEGAFSEKFLDRIQNKKYDGNPDTFKFDTKKGFKKAKKLPDSYPGTTGPNRA
jgi:hypothetical protein